MATKTIKRPTPPTRTAKTRPLAITPPARKLPKVAWKDMKEIYAVLDRRFDSGDPGVSARHNEHQP